VGGTEEERTRGLTPADSQGLFDVAHADAITDVPPRAVRVTVAGTAETAVGGARGGRARTALMKEMKRARSSADGRKSLHALSPKTIGGGKNKGGRLRERMIS